MPLLMTYCVAMSLHEGMLFASDSRTNAGVDNVATFSKMSVFEVPDGPQQRCRLPQPDWFKH